MKAGLAIAIEEKLYPAVGKAPPRAALKDFAAEIAPGSFVAILGPSGCGKTTLLNIIAGLDTDFSGTLALGRRADGDPQRIGYVFQNPRLLPWRTVHENIALVLPGGRDPGIADALLREIGLADARDVYPARLSLGMSRRVAIARAFAIAPDLLLLDEPFVSLDAAAAERLRHLLLELWRARPTTVIFVTHDLREALLLADRVIMLSPSPGRVAGDVAIPLPRERRGDAQAMETLRAAIAAEHSRLIAACEADAARGKPP